MLIYLHKFFFKIEFQNSIQDWVFLPCNGPKKVLRENPSTVCSNCKKEYIFLSWITIFKILKQTNPYHKGFQSEFHSNLTGLSDKNQ